MSSPAPQPINSGAYRVTRSIYRGVVPARIRDAIRQYRQYTFTQKGMIKNQMALPYWERRNLHASTKLTRVGFIGAGTYAQNHLEVLSDLQGVEIVSILTTGGPRVQEVASRFGIGRTFTKIEDFLAQDDVDCFVVVVPSYKIKDVAYQCLGTGKPVLMEKPAGYSSTETRELIDQANMNDTFGMVCMNRRFYSIVEHGLAAMAHGGPVRGASLEVPVEITKARQSGTLTNFEYDNTMFQLVIHGIDLLRYILGDVVEVHSLARPNIEFNNAAASFATILEHEHGAVSVILGLWDTSSMWRLKVIAESRWLELEPIDGHGWYAYKRTATTPPTKIPVRVDPVDLEFRMGVYSQDSHFIDAVKQCKKPSLPACLLEDAYKTNLLIEQILSDNVHSSND